MSVDYGPPYGFALRRMDGCLGSESKCYATWGGYWGCCPGDAVCPGAEKYIPNNICCPTSANCTAQLLDQPHCANTSWSMFYFQAYFCCEPNQYGFWTSEDINYGNFGCSDSIPNNPNYTTLNPVKQGSASGSAIVSTIPPTSTASSPATDTSTSTATSIGAASGGSSTNTGAIAGGVVGGVAGAVLIIAALWFFMRRHRASKAAAAPAMAAGPFQPAGPEHPQSTPDSTAYSGVKYGELDAWNRPSELVGSNPKSASHELPT
ncbi:predicted protein [Aspergillus terreus NIH2624]|uniref:Mid2 domain-containing protein n=1 Tax=Aspergillus terreus (strain NIH 2624 / FGSC A1156) TaxID=341663 RepID=Q0CHX8_ASPTN|nr:uncharacterized protein ATEG_06706 [Aspergillus terreus NIH2624]EAU33250.1 predicted protein [Aspergillus terreus NIH2624]